MKKTKNKLPQQAVYKCEIMHRRVYPFLHKFTYKVFAILVDLEKLSQLQTKTKILSYNRWNLFSFYNRDHGARNNNEIKPWLVKQATTLGIDITNHKIFCLCFPRVLGYVFNPITIYFCYHPNSFQLEFTLYEVKNTFGDQHIYLAETNSPTKGGTTFHHNKEKHLHVSPFIEMDYQYSFSIKPPNERLSVKIQQAKINKKPLLYTSWTGKRYPLSYSTLLKCFFTFPLMTAKIIAAIHWQAFKLWVKGAKFYRKPSDPTEHIS